ncbi:MAG: caspase family protein [Desulfobacterales bacterium]|nr:caspase family protein [Desulfobacterales bacterium]
MKSKRIIYYKFIFLVLVLLFSLFCLTLSCSSKKTLLKKDEFKVIQSELSKSIEENLKDFSTIAPTSVFSNEDKEVISSLKFENLYGKHFFQWKWYSPDGNIYYSTKNFEIQTDKQKYIKSGAAWHKIGVKGEITENNYGQWKVDIYMDDMRISSKLFEIKASKKIEKSSVSSEVSLPPILSIKEITFSDSVLEGGKAGELSVTIKNDGYGDAKGVFIELSTTVKGLLFEEKKFIDLVPKKGGLLTISTSVKASKNIIHGPAFLDIKVIEPNFKVKIQGKRLHFYTRKTRAPEVILAKFAAIESESSAKNNQIDINESLDLKLAFQNIGDGLSEGLSIEIINEQQGVMFLGVGEGERILRKNPYFNKIEPGKYEVVNYRYFVNSEFVEKELKFIIKAKDKTGKYILSDTKLVAINTELKPEGNIRTIQINEDIPRGNLLVEDIPEFQVDVDINIPKTSMKNLDGIAIVIGNRNYQHKDVPSVKYAHKDAETIKKYLIETLGYREGNIIYKTDVTKAEFEALFGIEGNYKGILHDYVKPNKSDVLIYYSGHGAPDPNSKKGYFLPVNCDPSKIALNGYPLELLYQNLSKIEAKSITVLIDACFSGGTDPGKFIIQSASPVLIAVEDRPADKNIMVLASSKGDEISSWYDEKQHSLFTYFFLKALNGSSDINKDKAITFKEIYEYLADKAEGVPYWAKRLHGGRVQTPVIIGTDKDKVFVKLY